MVLPFLCFLVVEMILGYVMFYHFDGEIEERLQLFKTLRVAGLLIAIALVNGLLAYMVAKSVIKPVHKLMEAAREISKGNLDSAIGPTGKDELGELAEAFESMRLKIKESEELQRRYESNRVELVARISHDLKTPMTSIKGYVKGLLDGVTDTPEKRQRYMETIYKKATDMDELIDELFLYSKLELDREAYQFEEVDLHAYFADFIEELSFDLEPEGGTVSYSCDPDASYIVRADRDKLKRVIANIVQNSLKHMDKAVKAIRVQLIAEPDQVIVRMADNGMGIPADAVPYLFDSFYRADAARNSSTGGSGLGLAIAKRIIEDHGGMIGVESKIGEGTTIDFTLRKPSREGR